MNIHEETLKIARNLIKKDPSLTDWVITKFPELKESEDEKIRKEILEYFQQFENEELRGVNISDWIAWLEKQGKKTIWHNEDEEPQRGSLILLIMQSGTPIVAKIIEPNHTFNHGERWAYIDDLLEKQGEKPQGKSALEAIKEEKVDNANKVEPKDYYSIDPHFGKPVDKVELFHEGDWVVQDNVGIYKVIEVCKSWYEVVDDKGKHYSIGFDKEYMCHLYTIQDAKAGDVLFAENFDNIGGCVFLFKGLDSWKFDAEGDRAIATGYCCTSITESGNTYFGIQGPDCVEIKRVHPATKEQRDQLEKAITEAGYEWDAEQKQLKKIEQKPAEWSEEDERIYKSIIYSFAHNYPLTVQQQEFVKSLRPQNHWKPTKEQMDALLFVIRHYTPKITDKLAWDSIKTLELMYHELLLREEGYD